VDDVGLDQGREHEHPDRSIGLVADLVQAVVAAPKRDDVARLEHILAVRGAQCRTPAHHE